MKIRTLFLSIFLPFFAGCISANINFPHGDIAPSPRPKYSSLNLPTFTDNRYLGKEKNTVQKFVRKNASYKVGVTLPQTLTDTATILGKSDPEARYYWAPDRLYWVPSGPLLSWHNAMQTRLAETRLFSSVLSNNPSADYTLNISVDRFLSLKRRRPGVDVFAIFFTSALFSSDEISTITLSWNLVRNSDKSIIKGGKIDTILRSNGNCYSAAKKPFKQNTQSALYVTDLIIQELQK